MVAKSLLAAGRSLKDLARLHQENERICIQDHQHNLQLKDLLYGMNFPIWSVYLPNDLPGTNVFSFFWTLSILFIGWMGSNVQEAGSILTGRVIVYPPTIYLLTRFGEIASDTNSDI